MKILSILFITFTLSFSANLLYLEEDFNGGVRTFCIDDGYYYRNNNLYFYDLRAQRDRNIGTKTYQKIVITAGWDLDTYNNCIFDESNYYGLTHEQYNYLMGLLGVVWGFAIVLTFILAV